MRTANEGLFVIANCPTMTPLQRGFCKIAEAKVVSGLCASHSRYIAYSVNGWADIPESTDTPSNISVNGKSLWVVKISNRTYNVYDVDALCQQHFCTHVTNFNYNDKAEKELQNIVSTIRDGLGFSIYVEGNPNPIAMIKRAWHVEHFQGMVAEPIEKIAESSNLLLADNTIVTHTTPYDIERNWYKTHRTFLVGNQNFSRQRFFKIQDN